MARTLRGVHLGILGTLSAFGQASVVDLSDPPVSNLPKSADNLLNALRVSILK